MADFERLKVAFQYHTTQALIAADGKLFIEEIAALEAINPAMIAKGLMGLDGVLDPTYDKIRNEAVHTLGSVLTREQKAEMIRGFLNVAGCDDHTDDSELTTIFAAAQTLGFSQTDVFEIVAERRAPGSGPQPPMISD